ncbi:DNA binding protein, DksA/TraR family [Bacillus thermotolerans]|uniref:DNA binding protein, DksA/TraR family n=2 Tax=Bacillus thermotolerans TaxID=1221996 RepID=A0A0F5I1I6_BACTR|nr:DNA binding protein, DksA/TraR family [Bacillus thermotolerans]KKB42750.1 DNA binding protein, DksA/TraR family [Bacillus thermotolerans]
MHGKSSLIKAVIFIIHYHLPAETVNMSSFNEVGDFDSYYTQKEVCAMLTSEQISRMKEQLLQDKHNLEARLEDNHHFDLERGHFHESMGELSSYDNHPADEGTELYEREKDIALNEHEEATLKQINKALTAIEQGNYGKCEVCGKDIPAERLEALPNTTYCLDHTPDKVVSHERPLEEGVLMPPFGKFDFDDSADESAAYDAEDAWQEVAQWGTSESPSDFVNPPSHYNDTYIESDENVGYVEDIENFAAVDLHGRNIMIYPNEQHERYEDELDEEGIMTSFGNLPAFEHDPYVDEEEQER